MQKIVALGRRREKLFAWCKRKGREKIPDIPSAKTERKKEKKCTIQFWASLFLSQSSIDKQKRERREERKRARGRRRAEERRGKKTCSEKSGTRHREREVEKKKKKKKKSEPGPGS